MDEQKESLDLVDSNDEIIWYIDRDEAYEKWINNFRTINCFIVNSEWKIWIPRRQDNKRLFPNGLDCSCGGHVEEWDWYLRTFRKEIWEELNINLSDFDYKILWRCNPENDWTSSFMEVYEINSDIAPEFNEEDFKSYEWLTPNEIIEKIDQWDISKDDLPKLIKKYYLKNKKWDLINIYQIRQSFLVIKHKH